ncbi:MAG: hypothetical protein AB7R89_19125, partial [Dehalococcoidia bacterium]
NPHFAAPHGDMMISGCFGLLDAFAEKYPDTKEAIERALTSPPGPLPSQGRGSPGGRWLNWDGPAADKRDTGIVG